MAEHEYSCDEEKTKDTICSKKSVNSIGIKKDSRAFKGVQNLLRINAILTQKSVNGKKNLNNDDSSKPLSNKIDKIPIKTQNSETTVEQFRYKETSFDQHDDVKLPKYSDSNGDRSWDKNNSSFSSREKFFRSTSSFARTNSYDQNNKSCPVSNNSEISNTNYQKSNLPKTAYCNDACSSNFKHESNDSYRSNKSNTYNRNGKYSNSYRNKKHQQYASSPKKSHISSNSNLDVLNSKFINKNVHELDSNDFGNYIFKTNNTELQDEFNISDALINSSEEKYSVSSFNSNYGEGRKELNLTDDIMNSSDVSCNVLADLSNKSKHFEIGNDNLLCSVKFYPEEQKFENENLNCISNMSSSIALTIPYVKENKLPQPPVLYKQQIMDVAEPFIYPPIPQIVNDAELFIYPPIPPPHPCPPMNYNSSACTNGYISSNALDDSDRETQFVGKSNFIEDANQYDEITSFLSEMELKFTQLPQNVGKVLADVNKVIKYYFNGNSVILYGSYLSKLAVTNSNMNLALKSNQSPNNRFFLQIRNKLYEKLHDNGYYIDSYEDANNDRKVKICFSDKEFDTSFELVYAGKTVELALKLSYLLKTLWRYDSRVKTLIVASRIWAEACGILKLDDAETGKLPAIGYTLLVVYFLQQIECPVLPIIDLSTEKELPRPNQINKASVGELWLEFLKFYSEEFDWKNYVVCITKKQKITKKSKSWENWIGIEDPFSRKNVAHCVQIKDIANHITSSFSASYEYFMSPTSNPDSDNDTDYNDTKGSSDDTKSKKLQKYSFSSCALLQETVPFCEECEESGGVCVDCVEQSYVPDNIPEVCKESMKYVDNVIEEICMKNILSDSNIKGRIAFVKDLEQFVKEKFPAARLSLFGSSVNGFGFECSDLDICMTMPYNTYYQQNSQRILRGLCSHLRSDVKERYTKLLCLDRAKIPLVKFSSSEMGWKCDISLHNVLAVHNSKLLNTYAAFDDRCRKLGCALKLLTKKADIAECVFKSLSSYSYILMTIHYLQQIDPPVLPVFKVLHKKEFEKRRRVPDEVFKQNEWYSKDISNLRKKYSLICTNTSKIGELWVGLLDFYLKYDPERAITITQKEPLQTSELERTARLFNIEDPFLEKRNLGCIVSTRKAREIARIFRNARLLFGNEKPKDITDLKSHYFSSMNITGLYIKNRDCSFCGAFGHDRDLCKKLITDRRSSKKFSSYPQRH